MSDESGSAPRVPTGLAAPTPPALGPGWTPSAVFWGPNGLRAGWRLLIFVAILRGLSSAVRMAIIVASHGRADLNLTDMRPAPWLVVEASRFLTVFLAAWVMAKIEGRRIMDYGLPWRGAFGARFWQGSVIGFAAISVLLLLLRAADAFYLGPRAIEGVAIVRYGAIWGLAFLFVGFFEEFAYRGYALFTLATGIGFWPAALILSSYFGYIHHGNKGESWIGEFTAGAVGFLFCLLLRRTGSLWMPIGFHAAWDWGESYFYGVPDSGLMARGHLFMARLTGPAWLTGGTVGPEGSWLCAMLLFLLFCVFALRLRGVKYPDPAAIPDPRRRGAAAARA